MNEKTGEDAKRMAQVLEKLMVSLSSLMEKETALLESKNLDGVAALREEKARLVRDYKMNIMTLSNQPDILKATSLETRARLRGIGEKLAGVTGKNALMLKAAITSTQSLIQTIIEAAREGMKTHDSYDDPRKASVALGVYSPLCDPVAVNRTV